MASLPNLHQEASSQFLTDSFQRGLAHWNRERLSPGFPEADWQKVMERDLRMARLEGGFLDQIAAIEKALAEKPLELRAAEAGPGLRVRDYAPGLQKVFHDINAEWIEAMFRLEPADREVLDDPQTHILDGGGAILFVEAPGLGIVGTCALRKTGHNSAELTKMGVRASARGLKAGEYLLAATIERAKEMGIDDLYLLTNSACTAAIHLYEKLGFAHDAEVMAKYAARYQRCDVAMRYRG